MLISLYLLGGYFTVTRVPVAWLDGAGGEAQKKDGDCLGPEGVAAHAATSAVFQRLRAASIMARASEDL
jgi:hypothetical protein